jgi:hypothetical protein
LRRPVAAFGVERAPKNAQAATYPAELVTPAWYHHIDGSVYSVGGALADYLLRPYGVEKFLRLFFTCGPKTYEADCRRMYGIDSATLEREFWTALEKTATAGSEKSGD